MTLLKKKTQIEWYKKGWIKFKILTFKEWCVGEQRSIKCNILMEADPALHVPQSGNTAAGKQAGRRQGQQDGAHSLFSAQVITPAGGLELWVYLTEVRAMPRGQKLHQEAHLQTCISTRTLHTHSHTKIYTHTHLDGWVRTLTYLSGLWKLV